MSPKLRIEQPNPDGLDEVFHAYHVLNSVLRHANLVPEPVDEHEKECAEAMVDESIEMLEAWIVEKVFAR